MKSPFLHNTYWQCMLTLMWGKAVEWSSGALGVDKTGCYNRIGVTFNTMLILVCLIQLTDAQKRKSKWDSAIPVTTIAQPTILTTTATLPGVVTVTTSASGSKTTVISAVGTIVKKAKQWLACGAWIFGLIVIEAIVLKREGVAFAFGKRWQDALKQTTVPIWKNGGRSRHASCVPTGMDLCRKCLCLLLAAGRTSLCVVLGGRLYVKSACKS